MPNIGIAELLVPFLLLLIMAVSVIVPAVIADRKGYPAAAFAIVGFFFPLVTILVVLVLPQRQPASPTVL